MSILNGISGTDLSALGITGPEKKNEDGLGQTDFLKLLVAQLNHQDPMSPQDSGDFLGQMAQFGTVDGINKLNDSFSGLKSSLTSNQALQASALVGRQVQVPGDIGILPQGGGLTRAIDLTHSTTDLTLTFFNQQGELVRRLDMGSHARGSVPFTWDGIRDNGNSAQPGLYKVVATASLDGEPKQLATIVTANVDSVTIAQGGKEMMLNLSGLGAVPFSSVKQIY